MSRRLLMIAGFSPLAVCVNSQGEDHVVLLQQHADMLAKGGHEGRVWHSHDVVSGFGDTVSLSEKGYQLVSALKSDIEMKKFIRRVAEKEARRITDDAELSGVAPFYSGTSQVQSLASLKQELRQVPWVVDGEGRTAPLSEIGYAQVAKLKSKPHMLAFARRILDAYRKKCSDEGALVGLVAYFDGEISIQSFTQLQKELLSAPWAIARDGESSSSPVSLASEKGPFDVLGWFRHDENEPAEDSTAKQVLKAAAKEKVLTEHAHGVVDESSAEVDDSESKEASNSSAQQKHNSTQRCDDWCGKDMFVKVEANSTVLKNLSSWGMKCSWAYCGGCSACSDPSLELEPPRRKPEAKAQALHAEGNGCEDWCSGDEFEVVHQNTTATKSFSWDMKCDWHYCRACPNCA